MPPGNASTAEVAHPRTSGSGDDGEGRLSGLAPGEDGTVARRSDSAARSVGHARVGCSGWVYPDWRGVVYPEGMRQADWFGAYTHRFDTVEINNTFYRLPTEAAVRSWVESSPQGFEFAVKVSRYLTHIKRLAEPKRGWGRMSHQRKEWSWIAPARWRCSTSSA